MLINAMYNHTRTVAGLPLRDKRLVDLFGGGFNTKAGVQVSEESTKGLAAYWRSAMILAQTIAYLPINVYQLNGGVKKEIPSHPVQRVINYPNSYLTNYNFRYYRMLSIIYRGAAYALIERDSKTLEPKALIPLHPDTVEPRWWNGQIVFDYTGNNGERKTILSDDMYWSIPFEKYGFSRDHEITPQTPIQIHRETLGYAEALKQHGSGTFKNGARLSGVLSTDHTLTDEQHERMGKEWQKKYGGSGNAGATAILESGLKYQTISLSHDDAQYIESEALSVQQISQIWGVPLPLLNSHEKSTSWGSGIYEMMQGFVKFGLAPWIESDIQDLERALFGTKRKYKIEYDMDALLKGDPAKRGQFYKDLYETNAITPNEIRDMEGRNPIDGGDKVFAESGQQLEDDNTEDGEIDAEE